MTIKSSPTSFPKDFPKEMYLTIFKFLDVKTICKIKSVCKKWNEIASRNFLWQPLTNQHYPQYKNIGVIKHNDFYRSNVLCDKKRQLSVSDGVIMTTWKNQFVIIEQPFHELVTPEPSVYPLDHKGHITDFHSSKETLLTASSDKTIKLWKKTEKNSFDCTQTVQAHSSPVTAITTTEWHLFTGSCDTTIKVWRKNSTTQLYERAQTLIGHKGDITFLKVMSLGNDLLLFSGSSDQDVRIWKKSLGLFSHDQTISIHKGKITALHYSDNRELLFIASKDKTISVWVNNQKSFKLIQIIESFEAPVSDLLYDKHRGILYTALENNWIKIWNKGSKNFDYKSKFEVPTIGLHQIRFGSFLNGKFLYALSKHYIHIYRMNYYNKNEVSFSLTKNIVSFQNNITSFLRSSL